MAGMDVRVGDAGDLGRGVFTRRAFQPGGLLLSASPLAVVVNDSVRLKRCSTCAAELARSQSCARCKAVAYCSVACQQADWPKHRDECQRLTKIQPRVYPTPLRLAFRVVDACERDAAVAKAVHELAFTREHVSTDTLEKYGQMAMMLHSTMPDRRYFTTASELVDLFCRIGCNAMYVVDRSQSVVGVALYGSPASMLNHSCVPNAVAVFRGMRVEVRAAAPIAEGEQVFVAYGELAQGTADRVSDLWERYQFICKCERCRWLTGTWPRDHPPPPRLLSLGCPADCTPDAEGVLSAEGSQGRCSRCDTPFAVRYDEARERVDAALSQANTMQVKPTVKALEELRALRHAAYLTTLAAAVEAANVANDTAAVRDLGAQLIAEYERRFPWHPVLANELFCQGKLAMQVDHETRARGLALMRRALIILERLYGPDDPMVREAGELCVELQHDVQIEESMKQPPKARLEPY